MKFNWLSGGKRILRSSDQVCFVIKRVFSLALDSLSCRRRDLVVVTMACLSLVYWLIVNNFDSLQQRVRRVCFGGVPSGVSCFQSWRNLLKGSWLQWEESVNFAQSSVVNAKCFNKSSMQLQLNVVSGLNNVQWENII